MNKLEVFANRLRAFGLSERQVDEAVEALNQYTNTLFAEMREAQQGRMEDSEKHSR